MNATQKKARSMKLSKAALQKSQKRKNIKKKGKKEGTWKMELRHDDKLPLYSYEELTQESNAIRWFTIEDALEIQELMKRVGKDDFLRLVELVGIYPTS